MIRDAVEKMAWYETLCQYIPYKFMPNTCRHRHPPPSAS